MGREVADRQLEHAVLVLPVAPERLGHDQQVFVTVEGETWYSSAVGVTPAWSLTGEPPPWPAQCPGSPAGGRGARTTRLGAT